MSDTPIECSEEQAEKFLAYVKRQFKDDPVPRRAACCCPCICWEDQMVSKHWLTWIAAVKQ